MGKSTERERSADEREADLDAREASLTAREGALDTRMEAAAEILSAADRRDDVATARDSGAETRELRMDRADFMRTSDNKNGEYGIHLPQRRDAALDREHAKGDRTAAHHDRIALTEDTEEQELG
jgi:hypothetical protein